VFFDLGDVERSLECLRAAVIAQPNSFRLHRDLGVLLLRQGQYAESITHLKWCLTRKPYDRKLEQMIEMATKERLRAAATTAAAHENAVK
jgi:Flp pilus assembly protein TadD